jgi:hypothetical protein
MKLQILNELGRNYFADFLRSDFFPELIEQIFAAFFARLHADFLYREVLTHCKLISLILINKNAHLLDSRDEKV